MQYISKGTILFLTNAINCYRRFGG